MKIGIFTDTYYPELNGVATSCESLFNVLKKEGHEVYLFCPGKKTHYDKDSHIFRIHGLFLKRLYGYRLVAPFKSKLTKFIKELHLDLIHINTEYGVGLIGVRCSKKYNIPIVYTYHTNLEEYTYYITKGILDNEAKRLLRKILRKYCYDVDEVIVPSQDTKLRLQNIGVNKFINVVPTGFDFTRFLLAKEDKEKCLEIKKTLQITDQNIVLLCLGRIAKEKNFSEVIDNFRIFLNKTKNYHYKLLMVGDGPFLKYIKKQVEKYHLERNIIFTGKVPLHEIQYYYAISDIYLNASTSETQGLTYMEAMASKLIVLTKKAQFLEGVINDNVSGYYYKDTNEFISKILKISKLTRSQREEITTTAYKVVDKFSVDNFYKNIIKVYNRAIRDRF